MTLIRIPAPVTLAKYGLTLPEWRSILRRQHGKCGVCGRVPESGRMVIDHAHVPGWKQMASHDRKKWVRGVTCNSCNHFVLTRYADALKHRQAADYLDAFDARREAGEGP